MAPSLRLEKKFSPAWRFVRSTEDRENARSRRAGKAACPRPRGDRMKRREFIAGLLVAATLGHARAQHPIAGDELRRSSATSPPGRTVCPGCSCPSGRHSSPGWPSIISCRSPEFCKARPSGPTCSATDCGYYLADQGTDLRTMQDCLGHRDPKHTAHYTRVAGHRFEVLWK